LRPIPMVASRQAVSAVLQIRSLRRDMDLDPKEYEILEDQRINIDPTIIKRRKKSR